MRRNRLVRPFVVFKILSIFIVCGGGLRTARFACGQLACGMGLHVVRFVQQAAGGLNFDLSLAQVRPFSQRMRGRAQIL